MEQEHGRIKVKPTKKIYRCDKCEYKTPMKNLMSCHGWQHYGQKLFKCSRCECSNTRLWGLREHMIKSHDYTKEDLVNDKLYRTKRIGLT